MKCTNLCSEKAFLIKCSENKCLIFLSKFDSLEGKLHFKKEKFLNIYVCIFKCLLKKKTIHSNCMWWYVTCEQLIGSRAFLHPLEEVALFPLFQWTNVKTSPVIRPQFQDGSHQGAFTMMTRGEAQISPLTKGQERSIQ